MGKHTSDFHSEFWSVVRPRRDILDLAQREHAVDDLAKDDVLPIKEIARRGRDEELQRVSYVEKQYEGEEGAGSSSFDIPDSRSCWDPSWPIFNDEPAKKTHQDWLCRTIDSSPGPVCFTWKFSS